MKAFCIQFPICLIIAAVSVVIEKLFGVLAIQQYMTENGLTVILALFAINMTAISFVITRFLTLESEYDKPYHFDESKKEAKQNLKEQFWMIILAYLSMFISPALTYFGVPSESFWHASADVLIRATVFMTLYATWDCAKSMINCSLNPESFCEKN